MNLLDIPNKYIPSKKEMLQLVDLIDHQCNSIVGLPQYVQYVEQLRVAQDKLRELNKAFRKAEVWNNAVLLIDKNENGSFKPKYPYVVEMDKCLACGGKLSSPSEGRIGCPICDYSTPLLTPTA
jgi:uncharacterized short protein YbdD (DUF466 family)